MQHIKVTFEIARQEQCDMLIALLSEAGYEGFEEAGDKLFAYISEAEFQAEELARIASEQGVSAITEIIPAQNWNALWESNFEPVVVADFCTIRADFHDIEVTTPYDILITPKMSFGTGHHATTQLMMLAMKDTDMKGATVLDFGTGTGVLAILAELLGAGDILAIDNDEWCVENSAENIAKNNCRHIRVAKGSLEDTEVVKNNFILANINRHILLQYMGALYKRLVAGGTIIMSGLLTTDRDVIVDAAVEAGFIFNRVSEQNNWISIVFNKQ